MKGDSPSCQPAYTVLLPLSVTSVILSVSASSAYQPVKRYPLRVGVKTVRSTVVPKLLRSAAILLPPVVSMVSGLETWDAAGSR